MISAKKAEAISVTLREATTNRGRFAPLSWNKKRYPSEKFGKQQRDPAQGCKPRFVGQADSADEATEQQAEQAANGREGDGCPDGLGEEQQIIIGEKSRHLLDELGQHVRSPATWF